MQSNSTYQKLNYIFSDDSSSPPSNAFTDRTNKIIEKKLPQSRQRVKENSRLLPQQAIDTMTEWYDRHYSNPYPTYRDCEQLAQRSSITINQVKQWFVNVRRRTQNEFRKTRDTRCTKRKELSSDDQETINTIENIKRKKIKSEFSPMQSVVQENTIATSVPVSYNYNNYNYNNYYPYSQYNFLNQTPSTYSTEILNDTQTLSYPTPSSPVSSNHQNYSSFYPYQYPVLNTSVSDISFINYNSSVNSAQSENSSLYSPSTSSYNSTSNDSSYSYNYNCIASSPVSYYPYATNSYNNQ